MLIKLARYRILSSSIIIIGTIVYINQAASHDSNSNDYDYIDTHMHLFGFTASKNQTMGDRQIRSPGKRGITEDWGGAAENLITQMDQNGVAISLVMPPPQRPDQRGGYPYQTIMPAIQKYPERLVLVAGGGTLSPLIVGTDPDAVTEEIRDTFTDRAKSIVNDGAKAFGEMMALHYSFDKSHNFSQVPADHPLFLLLADIAAQYELPIDIHMEVVLKDQPTPTHLLKMSPNNPEISYETISGFERLLEHNRNAAIVWQHVGWDNTGHKTLDLVQRLLQSHSNLYCAIREDSGYENTQGFDDIDNRIHDDDYEPKKEWIDLMRSFPDRFMIGSDEFINPPGSRRRVGPPGGFSKTWSLVRKLPQDLRDKIGFENARRIYKLDDI